ncbi:MAG: HAD-IB family hydrolase [Dehalococcoidales bacterium]|nr:HAD-IB family hydrolase [Dehalococcoidales bacterium]
MEDRPSSSEPSSASTVPRTRSAAFFDVDGTLVPGAAIWKGIWAYHFAKKRRRDRPIRFFLSNIGRWGLYKAGMLGRDRFYAAWGEGLAVLFQGLTLEEGRDIFVWVWENSLCPSLYEEVIAALRRHQEKGDLVVLVSATLQGLLEVLAQELGADHVIGSRLELHDGHYTGRMAPPLCFGAHKALRVRELLASTEPVDLSASSAYADSGHDAALLELVGSPIAVNPDPALLTMAQRRGWPVIGTAKR